MENVPLKTCLLESSSHPLEQEAAHSRTSPIASSWLRPMASWFSPSHGAPLREGYFCPRGLASSYLHHLLVELAQGMLPEGLLQQGTQVRVGEPATLGALSLCHAEGKEHS